MKSTDMDRLLRSAADAPDESAPEVPFGFDTRVVAAWRSGNGSKDVAELLSFVRRAGIVASAVLVLAGTAAYRQYRDEKTFVTVPTNEYAIADSAIQTEFSQ